MNPDTQELKRMLGAAVQQVVDEITGKMSGLEMRTQQMVERLGETCTVAAATRELHCSRQKIHSMMADGRLQSACGGTRVDVRSIAHYIHMPAQINEEARKRRVKLRYGTQYAV